MTVGYDQEGDLRKLPKWAQRKIEVLEMRLREAVQRYQELTAEPVHKPGAVSIGTNVMDSERALADHEQVSFWVGPDSQDYIEVRHSRAHDDRAIEIRTGIGSMVIQARNSNSILVEAADLPSAAARRGRWLAERKALQGSPGGRTPGAPPPARRVF